MSEQCSDLFRRVFDSHSGGCRRRCACGREHFDFSDNGWSWEVGELERLEALALKEPDLYIGHDNTIGTMEIAGLEIVCDCKCETAAKYERFICTHARQLAEYLRKRAKELRETADETDVPPAPATEGEGLCLHL